MRIRFALALLAALPCDAAAGPKDDVIDTLVKCADIADKDARIGCYDQAAPALRAAAQAQRPNVVTAPAAPPPPEPPPTSGSQATTILSSLNPFSDSGPDTGDRPSAAQMAYQPLGQEILPITIQVTNVDAQPGIGFTVTLANGQVWAEHHGHHETPRFMDTGNVVTIETGLIGGYNMYVRGDTGQYKVDRVK